jgi:hypothetical protein
MPNSVKYNTESEANALTIGNMHVGAGDVPKGPTSSTGFYNGINPPNGGYTIYQHKESGGPSILCPTSDAELIAMTNGIAGTSYTTINECFSYFAGQSGKFVLHNPINFTVTNGLVLNLSANILPSYPRSGTSWKDLSGESNNGVLTNSPTFNSNGWIEFDGTDDEVIIPDDSTLDLTTDMSFEFVVKVDSTQNNLYPRLIDKSIWLIHLSQTSPFSIAQNITTSAGLRQTAVGASTFTANKWAHIVSNYDGQYGKIYVNGELVQTSNFGSVLACNTNNTVVTVGGNTGTTRQLNGDMALVRVYDEVLTQADVNFNYYGGNIVTEGLVTALDFSNLVSYESGNSSGYSLTGSVGFDLFNSPTDTSNFGGGIKCEETDEFIALDDVTATDYVTIEVWYTRDSGGSGEDIVFNKENCWEIKDNGGNIQWAVLANNKGWFWYDSTANIDVGETVQFVLTYDGNYVRSYKNGELVQTYTYPSGGVLANQTSCYPKLNSRSCTRTSVQNPGNHTFYQFRIYDRALTDEEIQQNYNTNINKFN